MKRYRKKGTTSVIRGMLLVLALICLWGVSVYAADVAMINNTGYASLQEAVNAVQNSQTIVVKKALKTSEAVKVKRSKKFTIDFSGFKYTYTGKEDAFRFSSGTVTLKNVSLVSKYGAFIVEKRANVTFSEGKSYGYIQNYGRLTINNGTFTTKSTKDRTNKELLLNYGTLKVTKGTFNGTKDNALHNYGTAKLAGGTFKCTASVKSASGAIVSTGVYNEEKAALTITGGKYTSNGTVLLNRGTARVTNGGFTSKKGAGIVNHGKSMYIYKTVVKPAAGYLSVRNFGTFTIKKGCKIYGPVSNEAGKKTGITIAAGSSFSASGVPCVINHSGTVTIKGGYFTAADSHVLENDKGASMKVVKGTCKVGKGDFAVVVNSGTLVLSGGTYKTGDDLVEVMNLGSEASCKLGSAVKKKIVVYSEEE